MLLGLVYLANSNCANLGKGKEAFGDRNDILHLPNRIDSVLDSLSVFGASTVEDCLYFGNLGLSPVTIGFTYGLEYNLHVSTIARAQQYVDLMYTLAMKPRSKKKPTAITVSSFIT